MNHQMPRRRILTLKSPRDPELASKIEEARAKRERAERQAVLEAEQQAAKKIRVARDRETGAAVLARIRADFPRAFPDWKRPLASGMHKELQAHYPDLTPRDIRLALSTWCANVRYLTAVVRRDARRVNLDGSDAGPVADEQRRHARIQLKQRKGKK
ncbi:ProQ/FinO family protein [Aliiruegeria sabulilitoris]|uniref:ProQ/FinO family protein n=1 Tax=Aliiruegeria sabulilitoris TaxID=1510458 RepID=UPI000833FDB2|nr:ProQ/FinO family protein [Aliiruegeria sabulilitoris]NDR57390.1 hypothetical protein [Pseudoruegeria sp. M32A2M]